ncbi:MAG: dickkopf-related protein [Chitinivibrionales bacterium]
MNIRLTSILIITTCFMSIYAQTETSAEESECRPPCRKGFECIDGNCVSVCNPPCDPGFECHPESGECIPVDTLEKCSGDSECGPGSICLSGVCRGESDLIQTGLNNFALTSVFYGLNSLICLGISVDMAASAYNHPDADGEFIAFTDKNNSDLIFYTFVGASVTNPVTGFLNYLPKRKQLLLLEKLGEGQNNTLMATGWVLYSTSMLTSVLTASSQFIEDRDFTMAASISNAGFTAGSFVFNFIAYFTQQNRIEEKIKEKKQEHSDSGLSVRPYLTTGVNRSEAGITLSF